MANTALFHPLSVPRGCCERLATATMEPPARKPTTTHAAAALLPIRFQFANSSPRLLSLPADEIATSRKAHASINPAICPRGRIEPSAPKASSRSIQNNNSLQHPARSFTQPVLALLPWNSISTCFLYAPHSVHCKIKLWPRTNRSSTPEHFGIHS